MKSLKKVLMERDKLTADEAQELIDEAKQVLEDYIEDCDLDGAENVCEEMFGLEPDYLIDLY